MAKRKSDKKIIFVCTGNTCRSPMAELLLKDFLAREKLKGFSVSSAGIAAKTGDAINPKSSYVLAENGIIAVEFNSTLLDEGELKDAFAVICMTEKHKDILLDMRWHALKSAGEIGEDEIENNVYSLAEITGYDVPDPYGLDLEAYRYVFKLLERALPFIVEKLALREHAKKASTRKPKEPALDENGNPLPPKKRGRPKKERAFRAEERVPKKRGRPKKNL